MFKEKLKRIMISLTFPKEGDPDDGILLSP
jgi:hypothetical protein